MNSSVSAFIAGILIFVYSFGAQGQEPEFKNLRVEKKAGSDFGPVMVEINGKDKRVLPKAYQVWPVMEKKNAIVLIPGERKSGEKPSGPGKYTLRFFDIDQRKGRNLGEIPFTDAKFSERKLTNGQWVFTFQGVDPHSQQQLTIVADDEAIRSRFVGEQALASEKIPEDILLGKRLKRVFKTHGNSHVQFLEDGSAILLEAGKKREDGQWWTDSEKVYFDPSAGEVKSWIIGDLRPETSIGAGERLIVRLTQPLSSHTAKEGMAVEAVLVMPGLSYEGKLLLPMGSKFKGTVTRVKPVGLAFARENAELSVEFTSIEFPDGRNEIVRSQLYQVENSREKVDEQGTIKGIRPTGTMAHSAKSAVSSVAAVDPVSYLFSSVSSTAVLGFTEPEILYPAGTEIQISFIEPFISSHIYPSEVPVIAHTKEEKDKLMEFVRDLPFRTTTQGSNKPSDLTNLLFIGSPEGLRRAFAAAGWVSADQLTAASTFQTLKSIAGEQGYNEAPMSTLLLDERKPLYTLSKTTNTFAARHHLRVFDPAMSYQGQIALTSSSTQDIGIAFSRKKKTFIHVIDEYIDNERTKVVNDLTFTGCVEARELVPRSWIPKDAYNSTGDRLLTDGAIAVLKINDCLNPKTYDATHPKPPRLLQRSIRNTMLTLRNDVVRGNVGYQAYWGTRKLHDLMKTNGNLKIDPGAWQKADIEGNSYEGYGDITHRQTSLERRSNLSEDRQAALAAEHKDHRWDAPRYEIAIHGGFLRYPTKDLEAVGIFFRAPDSDPESSDIALGIADDIDNGWSAGVSVTLNTWRWVSSEFGYHIQRGKYRLEVFDLPGPEDDHIFYEADKSGLATRQFEYSMLFHAKPRESRWRPYVMAGPALQLIHLTDAPVKRAHPAFRLGMQNIGLIKSAFDFGRTPPLEGGGIFQVGIQYGAGIKFRVHPRLTLRADFRETWSKNPKFILDSYTDRDALDVDPGYEYEVFRAQPLGKFRQQRFTMGVAFTF